MLVWSCSAIDPQATFGRSEVGRFRQQVSSDAKLAQRVDRRDVLTDEPRDIRRMVAIMK